MVSAGRQTLVSSPRRFLHEPSRGRVWGHCRATVASGPGLPPREHPRDGGTAVGTQPALRAAYVLNSHLTLTSALAFFRVDSALHNAGAKNNAYGLAQLGAHHLGCWAVCSRRNPAPTAVATKYPLCARPEAFRHRLSKPNSDQGVEQSYRLPGPAHSGTNLHRVADPARILVGMTA